MTQQNPQPEQRPQTRQDLEALLVAKAWNDEAFKEKLLKNPKAVIEEELGSPLPETINVRILEETEDTIYISLPKKPEESSSEELSEEELEAVAGGIIGTKIMAVYGVAPWRPIDPPNNKW